MTAKIKLTLFCAIPCLYAAMSIFSAAQPFVPSEAYLNLMWSIGLPALLAPLIYYAFLQRHMPLGRSRFTSKLHSDMKGASAGKTRAVGAMRVLIIAIGAPLCAAMVLYMVRWYPASLVNVLAKEKISIKTTVIKVGGIRKTRQQRLVLRDDVDQREFSLHWRMPARSMYRESDTLTLIGRQHWLGLYVDEIVYHPAAVTPAPLLSN